MWYTILFHQNRTDRPITNHRNELIVVDMEVDSSRVLDRSDYDGLRGIAWSPDGRWLAYGFPYTAQKTAIKLCNLESGETRFVTEPVLQDVSPAFDPEGKYLYFLGYRTFNPVYDNLQFDLSFPRGVKPNVIMLQKDLRSPGGTRHFSCLRIWWRIPLRATLSTRVPGGRLEL